jgi:hypothetical protein
MRKRHPFLGRRALKLLPLVPYFTWAGYIFLALAWGIIGLAALGVGHPGLGHELGPAYFHWVVCLAAACAFVVFVISWWPYQPLVVAMAATLLSPHWLAQIAGFPWHSPLSLSRPGLPLFFFALLLCVCLLTARQRPPELEATDSSEN